MGNVITFPARRAQEPEPLWREIVGEQLRDERHDRDERISDVAERAGISPQYLSELERGRKDPSSEVLSAVTGALGLTVHELSRRVARRYAITTPAVPSAPARPSGPVCLAA